ncbi:MAG: hypothetical protein IKB73_03735 [Ruminococcus sp.]|nr:hypothetical protein [Ruminococcus sp.]
MNENGFIKLNRNILSWRWYRDANTLRVFLHLLLNANYKDGEFENHTIKRGQLITGRKRLAQELKITEQNVRTALEHLKLTSEISIKPTTKYTIITVNSYEKYQSVANKSTNNQPTTNQQLTNDQPQYKNNKKDKNNKNRRIVFNNERRSYNIEDFDKNPLFDD